MGKLVSISESEYHADRTAVSKSWLDKIEKSPLHLKSYLDGMGTSQTPSMQLGSVTHAAILEPDRFQSEFVCAPILDKRTKSGKEKFAQFEEENKGRIVVPPDMFSKAESMRDAVYANSAAKKLLVHGQPEQSVFWNDGEFDVECKARGDWVRENIIVDLKTATDASKQSFSKSIANYRYHVQAAHYEVGFDIDKFVFIVVESEPPHGVAIYAVDSNMLLRGSEARKRNLDSYCECKAADVWPGYPEKVQSIELPSWA